MHWIDFHRMLRMGVWRMYTVAGLVVGTFLMLPRPEATAQSAFYDSTRVEVRLHHETTIESAKLTATQGRLSVLLPSGGTPILRLRSGDTITVGRRQTDVYLRQGEGGLYAQSLRVAPTSTASWSLDLEAQPSHTYTGGLLLSPAPSGNGLQLVNRVPLADYVASVVAGEYGLGDGEGAKAMAIVARTYALFSSTHPGPDYDHVDGTTSQVYQGTDVITEAARQAARQTRGQILTYNGKPIQAVYFASSGGHTANNEDVWTDSDPLPYLRAKKDPYDQASPHHRWSTRVNRRALLRALTLHQGASVEGFLLGDRIQDRRLATIELLLSNESKTEIEASTFRRVVNEEVEGTPLKSTWFDARREGPEYVFEGRGYGHGVGLSQWGAREMARQGSSYREILSFYYPGTQIERLDDLSSPPLRPPVADESSTALPDSTAPDSTSRRIGW